MNPVNIVVVTLSIILMASASVMAEVRSSRPFTANACEGSTLNLECDNGRIDVVSANYGRTSKTECNSGGNAPIRTLNCVSNNSFDIVKSKCENHQSCSIQANNGVFGDPCVGTFKYLRVDYRCIEEPTIPLVYKKVACEGSNLNIECGRREEIMILRANYGRTSRRVCIDNNRLPFNHSTRCVSENSKRIVNNECSNKRKCTISASNNVFGNPCVGTDKYLEVEYVCVRGRN